MTPAPPPPMGSGMDPAAMHQPPSPPGPPGPPQQSKNKLDPDMMPSPVGIIVPTQVYSSGFF